MHLKTVARDCLYVNWAVPLESAPQLPAPLRYEQHEWQGRPWVLTTALLFRFSGLHSQIMPWVKLSYPQMTLRLYVLDGDDVASALFVRMLVPAWVVPMARVLGRQPAAPGRFKFPGDFPTDFPDFAGGSADVDMTVARWSLEGPGKLEITARPSLPAPGPGPDFGNWRRTVDHVRMRSRGYVLTGGGVRRVRRRQPPIEATPMAAEVHACGLLEATFAGVDAEHWSRPHSAWLCPEIPVAFELGERQLLPVTSPRRRMAPVTDGACRSAQESGPAAALEA